MVIRKPLVLLVMLAAGCSKPQPSEQAVAQLQPPPLRTVAPGTVATPALPVAPAKSAAPPDDVDDYLQWMRQFEQSRKTHASKTEQVLSQAMAAMETNATSGKSPDLTETVNLIQNAADDNAKISALFAEHKAPAECASAATSYAASLDAERDYSRACSDQLRRLSGPAGSAPAAAPASDAASLQAKEKSSYEDAARAIQAIKAAHPEIPADHFPDMAITP